MEVSIRVVGTPTLWEGASDSISMALNFRCPTGPSFIQDTRTREALLSTELCSGGRWRDQHEEDAREVKDERIHSQVNVANHVNYL